MTTHAREALAAASRRLAPTFQPAVNQLEISDRELHTVLAALRLWQTGVGIFDHGALRDIVTNGGTHEPLTVDEIDRLCERIN